MPLGPSRLQVQQEMVTAAEAKGFQDAIEIIDNFREDRDSAAEQARCARWGAMRRHRHRLCPALLLHSPSGSGDKLLAWSLNAHC